MSINTLGEDLSLQAFEEDEVLVLPLSLPDDVCLKELRPQGLFGEVEVFISRQASVLCAPLGLAMLEVGLYKWQHYSYIRITRHSNSQLGVRGLPSLCVPLGLSEPEVPDLSFEQSTGQLLAFAVHTDLVDRLLEEALHRRGQAGFRIQVFTSHLHTLSSLNN